MNTSTPEWEKEFESFDPSKPAAVIRENLQFLKEGEHDHGDLVVAEEAISDCIKSFIASELQQAERRGREAAASYIDDFFKEGVNHAKDITVAALLGEDTYKRVLQAARQLPDNK